MSNWKIFFNRLRKQKEKSGVPSPDWDDEELLKALGQNSGTMLDMINQAPELWREVARQSISIKYQRKTAKISLFVGIGAVLIGVISVAVAVWIPARQQSQKTQSELSALYRTINGNQNIFFGNFNNMRYFVASDTVANLPDAYIDYSIPDDLHQSLQKNLGIVNYTVLLYYADKTKFLNQTRGELYASLITAGPNSAEYKNAKNVYITTMNYLAASGWDKTKFNYQMDTDCLMFLLLKGFDSIPISKFDQGITCSSDSLNRIFYWFGYLPPLTPSWMKPLLKNALNQRQAGLGDQTILPDKP